MSLEEGRKWWAFQPVAAHAAPKVAPASGRAANKIDNFILAKLGEKKLQLSPQADKRTLVDASLCRPFGLQADLRGSSGLPE